MDKVFRKIGGFTFTTFKEISVYMNGETDEPWFLGSDIARALGMKQLRRTGESPNLNVDDKTLPL